MMDNHLKQIQIGKSNLAKAIMSKNHSEIEKCRKHLEMCYNNMVRADRAETLSSGKSSDLDADFKSITCESEESDWIPDPDEDGEEEDEYTEYEDEDLEDNEEEEDYNEDLEDEDENIVNEKEVEEGENSAFRVKVSKDNVKQRATKNDDKMRKNPKKSNLKARPMRDCPLKECGSKVIDLPRHLRDVHKWRKETAAKALSIFGMRKSFNNTISKVSKESLVNSPSKRRRIDYHRHRPCPVKGCKAVVKRLSGHLLQVHKDIAKGSVRYNKILKQAQRLKTWEAPEAGKGKRVNTKMTASSEHESAGKIEVVDDEEELCMKWEEDVECISAGDDEMSIFKSFSDWLQSADGGRKNQKLSRQHASQLLRILETIDPERRVISLFNKTLIRDTFLKENAEKKYTADTVKAYLLSLRHFCSYVIAESPESVKVNHTLARQVREKARLWSSSYKKESRRRHLEKMSKDLTNLVTPEMVNEYERSESARKAISYIGQLDEGSLLEINQSIYTLVRDYILLQITIGNAHRSGVLANMTVGEYKVAKRREGSIVINVKNHKTADTHGPARVVLSPSLFSYLEVYIKKVRRQVEKLSPDGKENENQRVFLSWSGGIMESGQVTTAINAAWAKGGLQGHVTSTLFRKSAVTTVHGNHKELKGDLADLMAHKETTAHKFYRLHEKEEACLQAAMNLPQIMRSTKPKESPTMHLDEKLKTTAKVMPTNTFENERVSWKIEELNAIKELFCKEIEAKSITMAVVREKIQNHPTLNSISPKKLCDRIRSEWRCKEDEDKPTSELPNESLSLYEKMDRYFSQEDCSDSALSPSISDNDSSVLLPSTSSYINRNIFTDEHKNFLTKVFGSVVRGGVISKILVEDVLKKHELGMEMLRKFTVKQIVGRLKYERRLNRRNTST